MRWGVLDTQARCSARVSLKRVRVCCVQDFYRVMKGKASHPLDMSDSD